MRRLLALTLLAVGSLAVSPAASSTVEALPSGCQSWSMYDGLGRAFRCYTSASGTHFEGTVVCSNGKVRKTKVRKQGNWSYGVLCDAGSYAAWWWVTLS